MWQYSSIIVLLATALASQIPIELNADQSNDLFSDEAPLTAHKDVFLDGLLANMAVEDLGQLCCLVIDRQLTDQLAVLQLHLMFAGDIINPELDDGLWSKQSYELFLALH